jgi:PAS domain S-box-containing protein
MGCVGSKKTKTAAVSVYKATEEGKAVEAMVDEKLQSMEQHSASLTVTEDLEQLLSRVADLDGNRARLMLKRSTCYSVAEMPSELLRYVSPSFIELFGYPNDKIIGNNCRFLQKDDRVQHARTIMRTAIDSGKGCVVFLRNYKNTGEMVNNLVYLKPLFAAGKLFAYLGCQEDVTDKVGEIPQDLMEHIANSHENISDEALLPRLRKSSVFFGESIDMIFEAIQTSPSTDTQVIAENLDSISAIA